MEVPSPAGRRLGWGGFYTEFWVSTAPSYGESLYLICVGDALDKNPSPCEANPPPCEVILLTFVKGGSFSLLEWIDFHAVLFFFIAKGLALPHLIVKNLYLSYVGDTLLLKDQK